MTRPLSALFEKASAVAPHVHAERRTERFSLLRVSAVERVGGAAVVVAALWACVYWALN
jgi:hypothetical protein